MARTESGAAAGFSRVGRGDLGYSPKQVEKFMEAARAYLRNTSASGQPVTSHDVRSVAFDAVRGGYDASQVDAALDRLEDALARRERDELIDREGEDAWLHEVGALASLLRGRLLRPDGDRFRRPVKITSPSYHPGDVDELCHRLLNYLEHDEVMSADEVRTAVFRTVTGRDGYEETQVDAFLDRCVELISKIA
ncbi:DivIVA domain-containing protein [Sinomonas sp. ASV322]|uniref:DivIVA domain-containing protein n=1 Tax=Sinomonas sp. ASV322 TaxID=3041920 RepID=UPI0027DCE82C|nr:DivIVA domain-containing protein [Sinomonas sp. ASV322]MDQ4502763.1 DivIVA domain-containing protein [Sinomonas sp. ASV322]